jgi:hypothetical protein
MAVAWVQEFPIGAGETGTASYDAISREIERAAPPAGQIVHTAGFDRERGVFRILDVWESRDDGQRFVDEQLTPLVQRLVGDAAEGAAFQPPAAEYWYELHNVRSALARP